MDLIALRKKERKGKAPLVRVEGPPAKTDNYADAMTELLKRIEKGSMRLKKIRSMDEGMMEQNAQG